jgi:hypothetical protein
MNLLDLLTNDDPPAEEVHGVEVQAERLALTTPASGCRGRQRRLPRRCRGDDFLDLLAGPHRNLFQRDFARDAHGVVLDVIGRLMIA